MASSAIARTSVPKTIVQPSPADKTSTLVIDGINLVVKSIQPLFPRSCEFQGTIGTALSRDILSGNNVTIVSDQASDCTAVLDCDKLIVSITHTVVIIAATKKHISNTTGCGTLIPFPIVTTAGGPDLLPDPVKSGSASSASDGTDDSSDEEGGKIIHEAHREDYQEQDEEISKRRKIISGSSSSSKTKIIV
ncbi:hypothetical protein SISSUDRAFT_1119243 [Sistotremastrum suecicum HHB10207 ss-3]|uniref:Uncharacterized protein n=1 Tax=Sistotremastrum suecicum HHB10207 ss-3 TaxID=1314776 RepID=A0A166DXT5_9AGAM|nr:hypothetical protein SISSUDRAFT_1119243 [Sistotremastrum suecicum HHB10207 ss-3]